ncbi:hypothetical protein HDV01_004192 [Terramyces sp. JEL0728]|nr:hypothetical protein HDV01_004192 [Terramyces sp. JEL0728]
MQKQKGIKTVRSLLSNAEFEEHSSEIWSIFRYLCKRKRADFGFEQIKKLNYLIVNGKFDSKLNGTPNQFVIGKSRNRDLPPTADGSIQGADSLPDRTIDGEKLDEMMSLYPFTRQKNIDNINMFYFDILGCILESSNISLFRYFVNQLVKRKLNLDEAKTIFEYYRKLNIKPQTRLYYKILFSLAKSQSIEQVMEWIRIMETELCELGAREVDNGSKMNMDLVKSEYNDIIKHAIMISMVKNNDLQSAIQLSNQENQYHESTIINGILQNNPDSFQPKRYEFNLVLYSILLRYHFYKKNLDQTHLLFNEILKHQQPTTFLLNIMVQGYFENDRVREGLNLFHRYSDFNIQPDSVTFTIILHYCTVKKLYRTCFGIYHQMRLLNIHLSLELWSAVIQMYVKQGDLNEALAVFNECKHYQPNRIVQGILMNGLVQEKQFDKVIELYNQLFEVGDDEVTRRYLIMALHHFGKDSKVIELYEYSLRKVDLNSVGLLIRMCQLYKSNPDILLIFYQQMQKLNLSTLPILNIIIFSLANQNREFEEYLSVLVQNNLDLHPKTYNSVLLYYSNKNDWNKINQIYDYPRKEETLFSFTMLLKANLTDPFKFKQILKQNTFGKDEYFYSVLILFHHLHGSTNDLMQVYNECKSLDSQIVLNTIVTCLIERDGQELLKKILDGKDVEQLKSNGIDTSEYLNKYVN